MTIFDVIKTKILSFLRIIKLNGNPNNERLTYISDSEAIRRSAIKANRIWYLGDGDELLNWYTNQQSYGFAKNPIYNRNKRQYFWSRSVDENVKRIHSGIPKAIVDNISNIVGIPEINAGIYNDTLKAIYEANDFDYLLGQKARPMTLVEGDGAWKININPMLSKHPLLEYYCADDWGPIYKSSVLIGMYFLSYYKDDKGDDYVLYEIRSKRPEGLAVEYNLYKLFDENMIERVSLDKISQLSELEDRLYQGINSLLAIPNKYYYNPLYANRGKSIFDGKLDLFDFLDEILTQSGQTNRVSTPVEYYPVDLLQRTKNGTPVAPKVYNRQFIKIDSTLNSDGNVDNRIQTTQPDLHFDSYSILYHDILNALLIGICSPATLGIDIGKRDNAEAQREKEKQTLFTRDLIVKQEVKIQKKLASMLLMCQEYMDTGVINDREYNISVQYEEFANPSFESELLILGPAWNNGQISTEKFVSLLWGSKLSDEELKREMEWLDNNRKLEDVDMDKILERNNEIGEIRRATDNTENILSEVQ